MRIAIVHDYLAQAGGAERVVEAFHDLFPEAPIYTSVYDPEATFPSFKTMDVRTSFLQKWARNHKIHKLALPFYPAAFEHFDMSGYDVVLSSTTGFAKGVITGPETCHICYCHTPARFAWRYHEYITNGGYGKAAQRVLPLLIHRLRSWDYASAQRVDYFVANSYNVARRIQKYYGRSSEVVHPPVSVGRFRVLDKPAEDYFLVVSRLIGYKRVDLAVEACSRLGVRLKVAGNGPDLPRLKQIAGPNVEFLGRVNDAQVADLFANCRAFLFPGEEDFGIAPLEAMACGRPVIAYGAGGALETVLDGVTGLHFREATVDALVDAIRRLDRLEIDPAGIRAYAETFDVSAFQKNLRDIVDRCLAMHQTTYGRIAPGHGPSVSAHRSLILSNGHTNAHTTGYAYGHNGAHNGSTAGVGAHNGNGNGSSVPGFEKATAPAAFPPVSDKEM